MGKGQRIGFRLRCLIVLLAVAAPVVATTGAASATVAAQVTIEPSVLDFGVVAVGDSASAELRLTNDTDEQLVVLSVEVLAGPFLVVDESCTAQPVDSGDQCVVEVGFAPDETGDHDGSIAVESDLGTDVVVLSGTGDGEPEPTTSSTTSTSQPPATTSTTEDTSPTTTPAEDPTDRERLAECERRARNAAVHFQPARQMFVDEEERFVVRATTAGAGPTITQLPSTTVVPVELRCEVEAQLRGGASFGIDPVTFQRGSFLDRDEIVWSWHVTPRRAGRQVLTLEIRSIAVIDGREIEGAGGQLFETDITISARPRSLWDRVSGAVVGFVRHGFIRDMSALVAVLAALAAAWRWVLKRSWPWSRQPDPELAVDDTVTMDVAGPEVSSEPESR